MNKTRILRFFLLLFAAAAPWTPLRSAPPIITEVMAVNEGPYRDEDGDSSDWIEVYNPGPDPVNLDGWSLSDQPTHIAKWRFPVMTLPAAQYLVVFASEKYRTDPARPLHTNFKLSGEGEFLGLADPQGNIVSSFSPVFPFQFPSVSYGLRQASTSVTLLAAGAEAAVLVPASGALGTTWTQAAFNDAAWTRGATGIGFDTGPDYGGLIGLDIESAMLGKNASAYLRHPFTVADAATVDSLRLRIKYDDGCIVSINGQEAARRNAPASALWNSTATAEHGQPVSGSMAQGFDGAGTAYILTSHATADPPVVAAGGPTGQFLRLMKDGVGSLTNTVGFDQSFQGPTDIITAKFDFRMPTEAGHTGCCGERADGFGFALLNTIEYGTSGPGAFDNVAWERPAFPDAFSVGFDIFDGSGTENTVSLYWNGAEQAAVKVAAFQLNNGQFNRATVTVRRNGLDSLVSVTLTPNSLGTPGAAAAVFTDFRIADMSPFDGRIAFGGRTGAAFTSLDIDNVEVRFEPASTQIAYEEIDLTARKGALQAGTNVLAIHGLNRTAGDKDFLIVPELTATDFGAVGAAEKEYFPTPTPGAPNGTGVAGVSAQPIASRASGPFQTNFSLTLSPGAAGTTIRYTLDGTEPTAASTLYTAPVSISRDARVKAKGFQAGLLASPTLECFYFKVDGSVAAVETTLPIFYLDTFGQGIGQSGFTAASVMLLANPDNPNNATDPPVFSGFGGLKIRGSSSTGFPKKSYAFEIWDSTREDRDAEMLGFPSESDYILYGPYTDKTLMRDVLSYLWSNEIGRWAVRTRFVEVFLKTGAGTTFTMGDYSGVYAFMEKIKRDRNRVDIRQLLRSDDAQPTVTGGYILKKDRLDPGDSGMSTSLGHVLGFVEPKEQEISAAQRAYIKGYLDSFEAVLMGPDFADPVDGYARFIDVGSFIDHHILVELTKNIDGYRLSTFMYKDRGAKLNMGPIWDYNLCLGNANYLDGWKPDGWYHALVGDGDYPWYRRLFQDPEFAQKWVDRWTELRRGPFAADRLLAEVDAIADSLAEAQVRNYQRWPILGTYVWPNQFIGNTYQEEIDFMKGWIQGRLAWIDSQSPSPVGFNQNGGIISPGFRLSMSGAGGAIYYTLDGTDPRLAGGLVSPAATEYGSTTSTVLVSSGLTPTVRVLVPSSDALALTWTQVGFNDAAWTAGNAGLGVGYENQSGYEGLINLDVRSLMFQVRASIYIRIPFTVADPGAFDSLTLKLKYDDGFVAYLNGQPVARGNDPSPLTWDAGAPTARNETLAVAFETIPLTAHLGKLRAGANVLAIHGLNAGAGSSDFLMVPELVAGKTQAGDSIPLSVATRVIARSYQGGAWSGPTDATFVPDVPLAVRITEVMYHPPEPPPGSVYDSDDFEFLELANVGNQRVSLLGARFTEGVEFDFSKGEITALDPMETVVLVKNLAAFEGRYGQAGIPIAGEYQGNLDNDGESVVLLDGRQQTVQAFDFDDLWYSVTDGDGYSLKILDPAGDPAGWNAAGSWAPSDDPGGSPGVLETGTPPGGFRRPGDLNGDARFDLADAIAMLFHLFATASMTPPCGDATVSEGGSLALFDVNRDALADVTDVIYALNYLFRGGPEPRLGTACARIVGCSQDCP